MFHPLIRLLIAQPHLLARHAGAYAELVALQAGEALRSVRLRAVLLAGAGAALLLGTGMAGVALLLLAVVPVQQMPLPWLLAAAPAVPLALALALWVMASRTPAALSLQPLQAQWEADLQLLAQAQSP